MRIWSRLGAALALAVLSACAATPKHTPGTHYFVSANLKVEPPVPSDEISAEKAQQLIIAGKPFYEVVYDDAGRIVSIKKHRNPSAPMPSEF